MEKIGFRLFYAAIWLLTLLPFRALYLLSDILQPLIWHVIRYRRKVVETNLKNAFPEKSAGERKKIARRFYSHFTDLFLETVKALHMTPGQMSRRFVVKDTGEFERLYDQGRDIVALCSHYNNWEWLSAVQLFTSHKIITIYKPLTNKYFDKFILHLRTKYGTCATPMQNIIRELLRFRSENILTMSGFIADQTPPRGDNNFWTTFLNQQTAFYRGAEKVAVKYDMAVVFVKINKLRRGYYELDYSMITEHPREEEPGRITTVYASMLEEVIRAQPEYWLWSHRRWKYKRPTEND